MELLFPSVIALWFVVFVLVFGSFMCRLFLSHMGFLVDFGFSGFSTLTAEGYREAASLVQFRNFFPRMGRCCRRHVLVCLSKFRYDTVHFWLLCETSLPYKQFLIQKRSF